MLDMAVLMCRACLQEWDTAATPIANSHCMEYENVTCPHCGKSNNYWDITMYPHPEEMYPEG